MVETFDYLQVGSLIQTRLQNQLSSSYRTAIRQGKPAMHEEIDKLPAVMIYLDEDLPGQHSAKSQKIEQRWLVWVINKSSTDAGIVISSVIRALSGWTSDCSAFTPLVRVRTQQSPDWSPNGVLYFPLAFSTSFVFN